MLPVQIERPEDFAWLVFAGTFLLDFLRAIKKFLDQPPARRCAERGFVKREGESWDGDCAFGMAPLLSA